MNKIRIVFFISNLGQGGAEKQFFTLIKELDNTLFEKKIILYAYQQEAFYKEIFQLPEVVVSLNVLKRKFFLFKIIEAGFFIRKILQKNDFDLVVSTLFLNNFLVRLFGPHFYKNRYICNVRTSFNAYNNVLLFAERLQIRNSYLVFNSKKAYSSFLKIIPPKFHSRLSFIYNGFEIPENTAISAKKEDEKIIIGCLGRMNVEKNFIQVVRAFQQIEDTYPDIALIIQGNRGNQFAPIKTEIHSEKIKLRDKNTDIEPFFNSVRILVLPSFYEGCPNVLFEALLRKKICIVSPGANSDNYIVDGTNGFVYDGTDEGLTNTLKKVIKLTDTEKEKKISESGFRYAKENFSKEVMKKKYEQLFSTLYEENKSSL